MREVPTPADQGAVGRLVRATGFFNEEEIAIAEELVATRLASGEASGYFFVFLESDDALLGYTCFGPVPATEDSWDLYWIAVDPSAARRGVGRELMAATEARIIERGGGRLWLDTAGRAQYAPTHKFYEAVGFERVAELPDYYAPGDAKVVYGKRLERAQPMS